VSEVRLSLKLVRTHRQVRPGLLVQKDHLVRSDRKERRASRATRVHKALKVCRDRRAKLESVDPQGRLALQDRLVRQARRGRWVL